MVLDLFDDDARPWRLTFTEIQAFRVTSEECAIEIIDMLPEGGGVFVSKDSEWLVSLGKGEIRFLDHSKHFIVPCYDEVVEVVASSVDIEVSLMEG